MSTFATRPTATLGVAYSDDSVRQIRVSECLLRHVLGLDVDSTPDGDYDRTVLEPAAARELAAELLAAAARVEARADR